MASQEKLFSLSRNKKLGLFTLVSSFGLYYAMKAFNEKDPQRFRSTVMNSFINSAYPVLLGVTVNYIVIKYW